MAGSSHEHIQPAGAPAPTDGLIEAVYSEGVLKPQVPLDLPAGARVRLQIVAEPPTLAAPAAPAPRALDRPLGAGLLAFTQRDLLLLLFGLAVYALTRAIGLARFPIYFFSDEAVNAVLADQLLRNGLRDSAGVFLPPYFQNDDRWTLSLSVYAQLASVALFGKSVLATRGVSALISLLAPAAVALTLKMVFKIRLWWAGALVIAALPAWFLHSRTAFEVVLAVSFYACFLCAYLLYRYVAPRYLFAALVFGAATFYSYANGQGLMLASGVLLLLSDLRFHLRQPRRVLAGEALLAAALAVPYVRFRLLHPEALAYHLKTLDSYWLRPIPLGAKLAQFGATYLQALSPGYWFGPNEIDLARHQMKGIGHFSLLALPFVLLGLGVCLWRWRSPAHRAVLAALLAAPFSAALVAILIPRVLFMVVPAALLICLGLDQIAKWLRRPAARSVFAAGCAALLCLLSFAMLRAALVDGPTWYSDYGLYGMQYGAEQVFGVAAADMAADPTTQIVMSPNWANNTTALAAFFLNDTQQARLTLRDINYYLSQRREINPAELFVLPPDEEQRARASGKLVLAPAQVLPYPNGQPGFYFVRMRYAPEADAIFAAEAVAHQQLKQAAVALGGEQVDVRYSQIDMGQIGDLFDNRPETLIRGDLVNPLVIELRFAQPRRLAGLKLQTARMHLGLKIVLLPADGAPRTYTSDYPNMNDDVQAEFRFPGGAQAVSTLRLELTQLEPPIDVHIHLRELMLY